jgi:ubiquinol-cytochrome c reductase cytochrome b subunit
VVGSRLWPTYAVKSVGLLAIVAGTIALLGGLVQINPIWLYGPFSAPAVSTAAQPDWYLGWVEGALRLMPPALVHLGPYSISEIFWPAVLLPGLTFAALYAWPFLEARVTRDHAEHHLLDRPSDRPARTAIGVLVLTFYVVLLLAGAQDIWADLFGLSLDSTIWAFRLLIVIVPVGTGAFAWKVCRDLQRGRHSQRLELETIPPIAPSEAPVAAPAPAPAAPSPAGGSRRRGAAVGRGIRALGRAVWSLVILVALRRAGREKTRAR